MTTPRRRPSFVTSDIGFEFSLARELGMTVAEMRERMSNAEFEQWRVFRRWEQWMQNGPKGGF